MSNKLGIMAVSMLAGLSAMPFSPRWHREETQRRSRRPADIRATQADLLAKSHGKQSKRAKRRKGDPHD